MTRATDGAPATSDELLLSGVQQHSELALAALFDRYGGIVQSLASSMVGEHARAEAVVLDVFQRLWNGDELYDANRGTPQIWLVGVTHQRAAALEESASATPLVIPFDPTSDGLTEGRAATSRPLRERLLARVRGEDERQPTHTAGPSSRPSEAFSDPFPEPAAPISVPIQIVEPPTTSYRAALEPIPSTRVPQRPRQRKIRLASLAWGIALLFVIAVGLFVWAWSATGPHASLAFELRARMPGGQVLSLLGAGAPATKARLFVHDSGRQAELTVDRLPAPPTGRTYQIWFSEPGEPFKSGGTFDVDARGDAVTRVTIPAPLERIRGISVTEESAGGSANPSGAALVIWRP